MNLNVLVVSIRAHRQSDAGVMLLIISKKLVFANFYGSWRRKTCFQFTLNYVQHAHILRSKMIYQNFRSVW